MKYRKKPPQFSTFMLMDHVQHEVQLKQTCLVTLPSSTVGLGPFNQPVESVPHLLGETHDVGIFDPAFPWKRNHAGPSERSQRVYVALYVTFLPPLVKFW